jgi:hypothetical protein
MSVQHTKLLVSVYLILLFGVIPGTVWSEDTLTNIQEAFSSALKNIESRYEQDLAAIFEKYELHLNKKMKESLDSGDITQYDKLTAEKKRFLDDRTLPDVHLSLLDVPSAERDKSISVLTDNYLTRLDSLKVSLTKSRELEKAREVVKEINLVKANRRISPTHNTQRVGHNNKTNLKVSSKDSGWISTGLKAFPGQTLTLLTKGEITLAANMLERWPYTNADGLDGKLGQLEGKEVKYGSIAVKIGDRIYSGGVSSTIPVTTTGEVFLQIYDPGIRSNNDGDFLVTLSLDK